MDMATLNFSLKLNVLRKGHTMKRPLKIHQACPMFEKSQLT